LRQRRQLLLQKLLQRRRKGAAEEEQQDSGSEPRGDEDDIPLGPQSNVSLLDQHQHLKEKAEARKESAKEKQLKEEEKILESVAEGRALMSVKEMAKGITYDDPIKTRYVFQSVGRQSLLLGMVVAETGRCTPQPVVPGASLDPHHALTVGHPPVMS